MAHRWFASTGQQSWATSPITENGFVRVGSHPKYPNRPGDTATVLAMLRQFCTLDGHEFWAETISLRDMLQPESVITYNHITDIYLLGLAAHKSGKLATLDRRIPVTAVYGGPKALELITEAT
jgi:hypothetical protein